MRSILFPLLASAVFSAGPLLAGSLTVVHPIADFSVPSGTKNSVVKLKDVFSAPSDTPAVANVVRFDTVKGNIDVQLRPDVAPATVANFLNYVRRGAYAGSFIHRSVPGFVIQGGGYIYVNGNTNTVPTDPPVVNEFNLSNVRGTIAMAKLGGDPNSATSQWFFNEADNSGGSNGLDSQNGGFTVFGNVLDNASLAVMDAIAALPTTNAGSPFDQLPVIGYTSGNITADNLVIVRGITELPATPATRGKLTYTLKGNTNPGLVKSATILGKNLTLKFKKGVTGTATITIKAKDSAKNKATTSFNVTVE